MSEETPGALVGRQRELADARAVIEAGLSGAGGLLLVSGEAGIGKTRLVEALASTTKARVVWGACWDDPGTPSFWPWTNVLRDCAESFDLAPGADLAPIMGVPGSGDGPAGQLRLTLFESAATFLRRAARMQPLLIVLEDLHVADVASLDLLRFLAVNMRGHPVILVATYRYSDLLPSPALRDAIGALGRSARTVTLYGLHPAEVSELIERATGHTPSLRLAARIHDRTAGNPLFAIEVAKLLAVTGHLDHEHIPVPQSVRQVIAHRLAYVSADALDVLAQASVAGQVFSDAILRRVTGKPANRIADLLAEATGAGLVRPSADLGEFAFTHVLIRDVLYAGIPAALQRRRHRLAAEALEALHAEMLDEHVAELADHYVLALPDADASRTLDYSRRAGRRALGMLAYEEAAHHFACAVDLAGSVALAESDRVELLLSLGDARMRAGDWPGATATYDEVAASARRRRRPDELARAALGLGGGLSGFEVRLFDRRQIDLLQAALDELGDNDSELRAWVLARLSVAESFLVPEDFRVKRSAAAVESARRTGDAKLLAYALSSYCDAIPGPSHTDERLALASEMVRLGAGAGDRESELLGRRFRLVALFESGDIGRAEAEIEAFARIAAELRWPLVAWYPMLWRATLALIEGRLDAAEQLNVRARDVGRQGSSVNAEIVADAHRLQLLLERGRAADAYTLLGRFLDDPEGGPNAAAWRALPLARMGQRAEARAMLDRLAAAEFPLVMDAAWLEVIASVAEACAELSHREAARKLIPVLEPYADRFATGGIGAICFGSMSRHLGLLAHCVGSLDLADGYFRHALAAHRDAGAALLTAHTLRQHAALLIDRDAPGDRTEAASMTAEAADTYRQLGLDHWVAAMPSLGGGSPHTGNVFRQDGDIWTVRYDGSETRIRDVKGMGVLARLLADPGREFHVLDLARAPGAAARHELSGGAGEVLDAQARQAYKRRLADLEGEIDDASLAGDPVRTEQAQAERDALVAQLATAYGLGGRVRRGNDPAERVRWAVTKQIHNAIARIDKYHPKLGRHLANTVKTGRYCSYCPEHPVRWNL